jgi:hypothetical protein
MDTDFRIIPFLIIGGGLVFIIYAWAKGWLKGARRGSFTSQVVMHDWLNQDKREAMEYVMDEDEEKYKKDALSGQDKEPVDDSEEESP